MRLPSLYCMAVNAVLATAHLRGRDVAPSRRERPNPALVRTTKGDPVADSASLSSELAGRYATALYELSEEAGLLFTVEGDLISLKAALDESADLRDLCASPVYSRAEQAEAMASVADAMGLNGLTRNVLGLMAGKRRLFALSAVIEAFAAKMSDYRGEVAADVTAAAPLTEDQVTALTTALRDSVGKTVLLNVTVDEAIIGGLVVKVGSKMIDSSIKTKLAKLNNAMKEVG
jgi:F-type H+-transporting ATPase subunit delta